MKLNSRGRGRRVQLGLPRAPVFVDRERPRLDRFNAGPYAPEASRFWVQTLQHVAHWSEVEVPEMEIPRVWRHRETVAS